MARTWPLLFVIAVLHGCKRDEETPPDGLVVPTTPVQLSFPPGVTALLGQPHVPADNPLTAEGIALGRKLFYEKALSDNQTMSCGTCHLQGEAFADHAAFPFGTNGSIGPRNTMSLTNLHWDDSLFWDGRTVGLEAQAHDPVVNPIEMNNTWPVVESMLNADPEYRQLFLAAFGTEEIDSNLVVKAIAQFERTMTSFNSPFDRFYFWGDSTAMSEEAQNGLALVQSQGKCGGCHTVGLFTDHAFRNNGLDLTFADPGLGGVTGQPGDLGKFRVPSLRNVALTAPYMHDARFTTLDDVLEHYNGGVHMASPTIDGLMDYWGMNPSPFSPDELLDLRAFLEALTDSTLLTNPELAEP